MKIYTITGFKNNHKNHRCFGFYCDLESAVDAVESNSGNFDEAGYYNYLLIEEVSEGVWQLTSNIHWYKWNDGWELIERPKWARGLCNFSIG